MEHTYPWRFNADDNVTSAAEEYDYDLLFDGPPRDYSNWQGEHIVNTSIPDDPDGIVYTPESSLEEEISSDLGESLGESDTESEKSVTSSRKIKKRGRSCDSNSPPPTLDP